MKSALLVLGLLVCGGGLAAADEGYPQPELLVEPTQLAAPESAKQIVILDARNQQQYEQGHVPKARWVDHATWAKDFASGTDTAGWSRKIGLLGITAQSRVVVYDDSMTKDAARIWWILRYWGVKDVRLLNGGWAGWTNGKFPIETGRVGPPPPAEFKAHAESKRLATKKQLLDSLKDKNLQIVDARSEKEFCGTEKMTNKRAGAIPGAKQLEWIDLIDKQTQRFKSPGDLRKIFQDSGIDLGRPTATHCQSGGRASVMAFGLELMGVKDVSNYYSSWSEWGNTDDTPIVPGTAKKK
jgi:thiosulfate/3-mercaptopyruvate sulfurtransferase